MEHLNECMSKNSNSREILNWGKKNVGKTTNAKLLVAIGTSNKGSLFNRKLFDAYLAFVLPSITGARIDTNPGKESF